MTPTILIQRRLMLALTAAGMLFSLASTNVPARDTDIYFTDPSGSGLKPNVLMILDTSGSMNEYVSNGMSRIDHMKLAMKTIIDESTNINMGIMRFSRGEGAAVIYPMGDLDAEATDPGNLIAAMQHSDDDASESSGTVTTTSSTFTASTSNTVGVRFRNVYIPRGATVTGAYLTFVASNSDSTTTHITVSADASDDAPAFSAVANDITGRTQTSASVNWNNVGNWSSGTRYYSSNISTIVQEIVNRTGWCGGNAIAFRLAATLGTRQAYAYDRYNSSSYEGVFPKLVVTYTPPATGTTATCNKTVVSRVSLDSDDAEERVSNGNMTTTQSSSNPLQITKYGTSQNQYVGVRFQNAAVPKNATIVSAEIEFRVNTTNSAAASMTVYGQAADNASTFTSTNSDISSRTKTTASVAWNSLPNPAVGQALKTPDLKTVVQEIVNRSSWASGNAMAFIIEAQGNSSGPRNVEARETAPGKAPFLRVTYQTTTTTTRKVRDELKAAIVAMTAGGSTPIVDALYEGALYMRGGAVDYGMVRENAGSLTRLLRVSHPLSYSGGTLSQPSGCTNADLEADACTSEQITGSPVYTSPVTAECQPNHMVLLTDGAATANNSTTKVRTLTGASSCSGSGDEACGVTLTTYLANEDQFSGFADTQTIHTHTIGINISNTFLSSLASSGKGTYQSVNDADELLGAFQEIVNQVLSDPTGFVSPSLTVNAFNRLYNQDEVYFSLFSPQRAVYWPGNVKKYRLCDTGESCTFGEVLDANDVAAINPDTSKIEGTAESFWSGTADGPDVNIGGAGSQVPAYASRNVYTYTGTTDVPTSAVDLMETAHIVQTSNTAITKTMLGNASMTDTERNNIINWMRGQDVQDDNNNGSSTDDRWKFADALHSRPITVTFGGTAAAPVTKLFVGTNDGGLRMINADTGVEEWIVYPPDFLDDMKTLMDNNNGDHTIGLDGAPSAWIVDNDNDGIIEPGNNDKVYLYIGMRRGGRGLYAFDVTPDSVLSSPPATGGIKPKFLWRIYGGVAGDFAELGQTWSYPRIATIRVKCPTGDSTCDDGVSSTKDSKKTTALIFGGGYDPAQDNVMPSAGDSMGRAIYMVDPLDGSLIWSAGGSGSGATLEISAMNYSIPSDIGTLDSNGDGAVDRLYVGDTRGQIFRFDLSDQIDPDASSASQRNGDTSGYVFADVGCTGGSRSNHCSATAKYERRKFFYAPAIAQAHDGDFSTTADYDLVAIATGDREDPLDKITDGLSVDPVHNRIYALRDYNYKYGAPSTAPATLTDSDLYDSTSNALQDPSGSGYAAAVADIKAADGWRVDLKESSSPNWIGEKGLARPTVFGGVLYATTYVPPSDSASAETCPPPAEGTARLYGLNYLSGAGIVDLDNSGGTERSIELGGGIPSEVVVVIREGGTSGLVGTSGGASSGGQGEGQWNIDNGLPRSPTYWTDDLVD